MATKSILKTVYIKNNDSARNLANAIDNSSNVVGKKVIFSRSVSEASREDLRKMFSSEDRT